MRSRLALLTSLSATISIVGCQSGAPSGEGTPVRVADAGRSGDAGGAADVRGPEDVAPDEPALVPDAASSEAADTLCGDIQLTAARTIAAGKTVTICAGSTLTASVPAVGLIVEGTLQIQGTAQKPVKLVAAQGGSTGWSGLSIAGGGKLSATYLEIHNAAVALTAQPGATYTIDHLLIDSSDAMMMLAASGSIAHGALHGLGDNQSSTPIAIATASPRITDTVVDQGQYQGVDMIVVDGDPSAPVFDHVEVADAHCAFHFDSGHGVTISNSYVHHNSYGLMLVGAMSAHVVHNNFEDDAINIGSCAGGSSEVKDNYFGGAPFDDSCATLTTTGTAPPGPYPTGVGPTK